MKQNSDWGKLISNRAGTHKHYGKCSKISKSFLILFSHKTLVIRDEIHKMLDRIASREDPDQTASSEAVGSGSALFV